MINKNELTIYWLDVVDVDEPVRALGVAVVVLENVAVVVVVVVVAVVAVEALGVLVQLEEVPSAQN